MNWPFVWIATHYMEKGDYPAVKKTCLEAFKRPLVLKFTANCLSCLLSRRQAPVHHRVRLESYLRKPFERTCGILGQSIT